MLRFVGRYPLARGPLQVCTFINLYHRLPQFSSFVLVFLFLFLIFLPHHQVSYHSLLLHSYIHTDRARRRLQTRSCASIAKVVNPPLSSLSFSFLSFFLTLSSDSARAQMTVARNHPKTSHLPLLLQAAILAALRQQRREKKLALG